MDSKLCPGDLMFWSPVRLKDSEIQFDDAVSAAGGGPEEPFHLSLIVDDKRVVHAVHKGVCLENVSDVVERFLKNHQKLKITVASLSVSDEVKSKAVLFAIGKINIPYNDTFSEDLADSGEAYYCCQLIRKAYLSTGVGIKFPMRPVNFHDSDHKLIPYWVEYFRAKGLEVPEQVAGSHPADLIRSDIIKILSETFVESKL